MVTGCSPTNCWRARMSVRSPDESTNSTADMSITRDRAQQKNDFREDRVQHR